MPGGGAPLFVATRIGGLFGMLLPSGGEFGIDLPGGGELGMLLPCAGPCAAPGGELAMLLPCGGPCAPGGELGILLPCGGPAGFAGCFFGVAALLRGAGGAGGRLVRSDSCEGVAVLADVDWGPRYEGSWYRSRLSAAQSCTNARFCAMLVGAGAPMWAASSLTRGPRSDALSEPSREDARRIFEYISWLMRSWCVSRNLKCRKTGGNTSARKTVVCRWKRQYVLLK